jgi:hypothetical protein
VKRGQDIQAVAMKVALVFDNKHQCRDTSMFSDKFPIQVQSIYVLNVYTNINRKIQYQYIYLMTEIEEAFLEETNIMVRPRSKYYRGKICTQMLQAHIQDLKQHRTTTESRICGARPFT